MTYDAERGKVVLFGGNGSSGPSDSEAYLKAVLDDTWTWDGSAWAREAGAGPTRRDHHAMAYDNSRREVVLFGGWDGRFLADLWEWDGAWKRIEAPGPSARGGLPSLVYDPSRRVVFLYGGWGDDGAATDIWTWDGRSWNALG